MAVIERTPEAYAAAFEKERRNEYPVIDEFERRMGFAVDRDRLEAAARVLACPVKKNPPNWQHGRVIYALGRHRLAYGDEPGYFLDIGTAKGFSAVFMAWAQREDDTGWSTFDICSVDIIDPSSNEPRNSVIDGQVTNGIYGYVEQFAPLGIPLRFYKVGDRAHTNRFTKPIPDDEMYQIDQISFAFIDGSHTYEGVKSDVGIVAPRQQSGDIMLFDDLQKPSVARAVSEIEGYEIEYLSVLPLRQYAIAVKQ